MMPEHMRGLFGGELTAGPEALGGNNIDTELVPAI